MDRVDFENKVKPQLFEYLLVISPPNNIIKDVRKMKKLLSEHIGSYLSDKSIAHITIGKFWFIGTNEETLRKALNRIGERVAPFDVFLKNFGKIGEHTFFIKPVNTKPINELKVMVREEVVPVKSVLEYRSSGRPHMTIGTNLHRQMKSTLELFSNRSYKAKFTVEELLLLKKVNLNSENYNKAMIVKIKGEGFKNQLSLF